MERIRCEYLTNNNEQCKNFSLRGSNCCTSHNKNPKCGIYKITLNNLDSEYNNKSYIGQSLDIYSRWDAECRPRTIDKMLFQNCMKKYGFNSFIFEIIEECSIDIINEREEYYIKQLNTLYPNGFNFDSGGKSNKVVHEDTRKKQSDAKKGEKNPWFGKGNPPAIKALIASSKGKVVSQETREKQSESAKNKEVKSIITPGMLKKATESKHKAVKQYKLESGELINEFPSLLEASEKTNIKRSSIGSCCNKRALSTYIKNEEGIIERFIWKFSNEHPPTEDEINIALKSIFRSKK